MRASFLLSPQRFILTALPLSLAFATSGWAEWHDLIGVGQSSQMHPAGIELIDSNPSTLKVRFQLNGFDSQQVRIQGNDYVTIFVPGLQSLDEKGYPELPRLNRNLMIPATGTPSLEVVSMKTRDFELGTVAPSKGVIMRDQDPEKIPYSFASIYTENKDYPETVAEMSKAFQMRDVRGVNLSIRPFRFNARTGKLQVIEELVVAIRTVQPKGKPMQLFVRNGVQDAAFTSLYREAFLNYENTVAARDVQHLVEDTGRLLVIYHPAFKDGLDEFVKWKIQKGIRVELASLDDTGKTYAEIKSFIANKYRKDRVSTVLLVGDSEFIPFHPGNAGNARSNEADPLYGTIEGNDNYPEVMVSRFSVKNLDGLKTIVTKIVQYERSPDAYGDWYAKAVGIASDEGSPTDYERAEILRGMLEAWQYRSVDKLYAPTVRPADIARALNEGRGFINYIGHGSQTSWVTGPFTNRDIDALSNGSKLPFIVSVACVNGNFAGRQETFAERWLLAGTPEQPKGAVAIFASSTNQSWVPPTVGQKEIARLLTAEKMNTIGTLFVHGSIAVLEDGSSSAAQTFQTWHIFGDATMQVRTRAPAAIKAVVPRILDASSGTIELGLGVPGITVGLSQNGRYVASGKSDANGIAVLQLESDQVSSDDVLVTLTGFNRIPETHEAKIQL